MAKKISWLKEVCRIWRGETQLTVELLQLDLDKFRESKAVVIVGQRIIFCLRALKQAGNASIVHLNRKSDLSSFAITIHLTTHFSDEMVGGGRHIATAVVTTSPRDLFYIAPSATSK
ncbi:uncharacterized protein KRP23_1260 [Phytophthora ramorum]|uniref:uncharacterized protein n=1 Tax=Phytophthora ramorum TaxID=164328 RepID=UPI0030AA17C8|nr:hypothetical protein KRP23_1260 [Phytophthora ramorum]